MKLTLQIQGMEFESEMVMSCVLYVTIHPMSE